MELKMVALALQTINAYKLSSSVSKKRDTEQSDTCPNHGRQPHGKLAMQLWWMLGAIFVSSTAGLLMLPPRLIGTIKKTCVCPWSPSSHFSCRLNFNFPPVVHLPFHTNSVLLVCIGKLSYRHFTPLLLITRPYLVPIFVETPLLQLDYCLCSSWKTVV